MNGNNNKIGRIFSININSDQDYQTYAAHRKSSVVHETSGQIHSVLNQKEVGDVDSSVDGEFRLKEHIDVRVPSNSLLTGELVTKFGTKICGCCGALLSAIGIAVCFIAPNLEFLIFFVGVMSGAGFSLNAICASTSVSQNFLPKKRVLALAFVSTGSGIGTLCFPLLLQYFIDTYGWRGCLLIISGIVLNQLACGLMSGPDVIRPAASKFQQNMTENNETGDSNTTLSRLKATLQNKVFIGFCFALSLILAAFDGLIIFFVDFFEQKGFNRTSVVWLYSGMSIVSMIFRFISGLIAQSPKVPKLAIPAMCAFLGCISLSLLPFMTSYSLNAVAIALFGSALGGTVTVVSITTLELVGEKKFPTGLGIVFAASGIANIVGAPIAGNFRDISGSYTYSVLSGAGACLLACFIFTLAMIYQRRHGEDPRSRFNMEINVNARWKSRRRSSFLPWRESVDLGFSI
uniref:Monocarboxylate transporter 13 n=1 Tax=Magallana gigas TaxID=29159 RepID=K1R1R8_MAGGI